MKIQSVRSMAEYNGVKLIGYGPPGSWKTPCCATAPRPFYLGVETGVTSFRSLPKQMDFPGYRAKNAKDLNEFKSWVEKSNELKNFDTLCIDSLSQVAEHYLVQAESTISHGKQAYGKMADDTRAFFDLLNTLPQKHVYFICKMSYKDLAEGSKRIPYFPGNALGVYIPHEVDEVYYASKQYIPGGSPTGDLCWQTFPTNEIHARTRNFHVVAPYEPCHLGALFDKIRKGSNP